MNMLEMIQKGYEAQKQYCERKHMPMFITQDCRCTRCGRYVIDSENGYSVEESGSRLISSCPYCNASFCD